MSESWNELAPQFHLAAQPFHDPHQVWRARERATNRHEIGDAYRTAGGLELRLQDQGSRPIAAARRLHGLRGSDFPVAVLAGAEKRQEAHVRIEIRQAQEVDRTVPRYEGRCIEIADQSVIFDECARRAGIGLHRCAGEFDVFVLLGLGVHATRLGQVACPRRERPERRPARAADNRGWLRFCSASASSGPDNSDSVPRTAPMSSSSANARMFSSWRGVAWRGVTTMSRLCT